MTFRHPVPSFSKLTRQVRTKDQDGRHCVVLYCRPPSCAVLCHSLSPCAVPYHPPPSSPGFQCITLFAVIPHIPPQFPIVPHYPPPSPAVLYSYLPSPGRKYLRSCGSSSLLITTFRGVQAPGQTTFYHPVSSGGLGSPPAGPHGGP